MNLWVPMVTIPFRAGPVLACTVKLTVPLPVSLAAPTIEIQGTFVDAVQAHVLRGRHVHSAGSTGTAERPGDGRKLNAAQGRRLENRERLAAYADGTVADAGGIWGNTEVHRPIPAPAPAIRNGDPIVRGRGRPTAAVRAFDGETSAAALRTHVQTVWLQVESAGHSFLHHLQDLPAHRQSAAPGFGIGVGRHNIVDGPVTLTACWWPGCNPRDVARHRPRALASGSHREASGPS